MYDNPWRVNEISRLQRDRVQEEMRQIRLEEEALRAQVRRPGLIEKLWAGFRNWLKSAEQRPAYSARPARPLTLAQAKHHGHI